MTLPSIVDPVVFSQKYHGAFLSMEISEGTNGNNPTLTVTVKADNGMCVVVDGVETDIDEFTFVVTEPMEIGDFKHAMKAFK